MDSVVDCEEQLRRIREKIENCTSRAKRLKLLEEQEEFERYVQLARARLQELQRRYPSRPAGGIGTEADGRGRGSEGSVRDDTGLTEDGMREVRK
jgi:hypothetical protein